MASLSDQIEDFWLWFDTNHLLLQEIISGTNHPKTAWVVEQLDQLILSMGKLKWEIDTPSKNTYSFMVSPNNDSELLKTTKAIIGQAKNYPNWSFYPAKQASEKLEIEVYDDLMDLQTINAEQWRVVLTEASANTCDMILEIASIGKLDEDTKTIAADLILTAVLGEEVKINSIAKLELVLSINTVDEAYCFPIQELKTQLLS